MGNIVDVVAEGLCTGCGTCSGVCPSEAISMHVLNDLFLPRVDANCNYCGLCLSCCPGSSVDFRELNSKVFGKQPEDPFIGNFLNCYMGHLTQNEMRHDSSSGGVVTGLLIFALESGMIDGAVVVRMGKDNPFQPEPIIARTRQEIVAASKSKYCPVATNAVLEKIRTERGKFAIVGLPCHMHGLRKAEANIRDLKSKIVLHVGLFCGHTVNFAGTEALLRKFHIEKSDVADIEYRGCGWPGLMSIRLRSGRILRFRFNRGWIAYWNMFSPFFFTPIRCMMCSDQFNELSDISVGDAWLPELRGRRDGESIIITRNTAAEEVLDSMVRNRRLVLGAVPPNKAKESQAFSLNYKKENIAGRLFLLRSLGRAIPSYGNIPTSLSLMALPSAFLSYLSYSLSSNKLVKSILVYVPLPIFRLYFGLFNLIFLLFSRIRG